MTFVKERCRAAIVHVFLRKNCQLTTRSRVVEQVFAKTFRRWSLPVAVSCLASHVVACLARRHAGITESSSGNCRQPGEEHPCWKDSD